MAKKNNAKKQAAAYLVDTKPGPHSYVFVEGVGECRTNFMRMVEGIDKGEVQVLVVAQAELLFIDTSPMWMETFIATVKRHQVAVADVQRNQEFDLRKPEDAEAFLALGKK